MNTTLEKYYGDEVKPYSDPVAGPGTEDLYGDLLSQTPGLDGDYDIESGENLSDDEIGTLLDGIGRGEFPGGH